MIGQFIKSKLLDYNCFVKNDKHTVIAIRKNYCIFITPKNKKNEKITIPNDIDVNINIFMYKINLDKETNTIQSIKLYYDNKEIEILPSNEKGLFTNLVDEIIKICES